MGVGFPDMSEARDAAPDPGRATSGAVAETSRWSAAGIVGFALLVYVPIMLTAPGQVAADTKSYPYLDPSRFIGRISSLWDPNIGMGTVTHQNIGYLFPLGPFYWVTHGLLGVPAWVAQRLWLGTLLFAAGLGVRYLLRTLGVRGPGIGVAMLAYALSPYATEFSARLSVLLGPWAALPWMIGLTARALRERERRWKYPALFAITVLLVGAVNATALLYALIGPAAWVVYAIWVRREVAFRTAWGPVWRAGLLTFLTSLWWMVGLVIEGAFGMGILRFTESVEVVSHTSTATEIVRGLGYWFFYGGDLGGAWNDAVLDFTRRPWLIAVSFLLPALALLAVGVTRWKHRAFFVSLVVIGMVIAVAASPYDDPTLLGSVFKAFATSSTAGFALRSTARAVPLLALGLAVMLGVGVSSAAAALARHRVSWLGVAAAVIIGVLCVVNAPGIWNGRYYSSYLERDEQVPAYWRTALAALDRQGSATRVLGLPGSDFAAYRWGDTIDPIEPGLMDRPYVARELVPWGGEATTNLLIAVDRRVQDRLLNPEALAPIARLMGAGDVLLRLDLQTDQFNLVSARDLYRDLVGDGLPKGIGTPIAFGTKIPGRLLGNDLGDVSEPPQPDPPPVVDLPVRDPVPIVRTKSAVAPLVVDGDGEGLIDAAGAGLLDGRQLVVSSPEYDGRAAELRRRVPSAALLVVTDTNRRRGMRWAGMHNNYGYTEQAGETPMKEDLLDQRLDVFPGSSDSSKSVVAFNGVRSVRATTYGTPAFGFAPHDRPALALDGDLKTAWEVAAGVTQVPDSRWKLRLVQPTTTDHVRLVQAIDGPRGRWVTKVGMRFDGGPEIVRDLTIRSRRRSGEVVTFPRRRFSTFELRIIGTDANKIADVPTERGRLRKTGVGFAEIELAGPSGQPVRATETTVLPSDLVTALGGESSQHALAYVLTRDTASGELEMRRRFEVPTARSFGLSGSVVLNDDATSDAIDRAVGIPGPEHGGISASSSERLTNLNARASSAFDGDLSTAWNSRSRDLVGQWIQVTAPAPVTIGHLDLALLDDGRHSVPTKLRLSSDTGESRTFDVPTGTPDGDLERVPVDVEPITGRTFRVTVEGVARTEDPRCESCPDHVADRHRRDGHSRGAARAVADTHARRVSRQRTPCRRHTTGSPRSGHHCRCPGGTPDAARTVWNGHFVGALGGLARSAHGRESSRRRGVEPGRVDLERRGDRGHPRPGRRGGWSGGRSGHHGARHGPHLHRGARARRASPVLARPRAEP